MHCTEGGVCTADLTTCPVCLSDEDCQFGVEWCVGNQCVTCDDSAEVCDIDCGPWGLYTRNGCTPCDCAPGNECLTNDDCLGPNGTQGVCYPGKFCWDYCVPGDPSCCRGNQCSAPGCEGGPPEGCVSVGCPVGQTCVNEGCSSSSCSCSGGDWSCTDDCGGGMCVQ